jgi:hypothetical protein
VQQPAAGGGMMAGLGATIMQGMAFGTGSAIAHRAVGAAAGAMSGGSDDSKPEQQQQVQQQQVQQHTMTKSSAESSACQYDMSAFNQVIKTRTHYTTFTPQPTISYIHTAAEEYSDSDGVIILLLWGCVAY